MTHPEPDLTDLDARARAAARALNASVAATVDHDRVPPAFPSDGGRRRGGPARWLSAAAVVAVLGGVVTVAATRDPDTTDRVEIDVPDPDGDAPDGDATGLELAGPRDGRDSVALPVTVTPAEGLADGEVVAVTATGFEPGEQVGVVLCGSEAGLPLRLGVDACNTGTAVLLDADDDGAVAADIAVARTLTTPVTGTIDCAAEPGRCIVAVGALADYDRSGGGAFTLDAGTGTVPALPVLEVAPSDGLAEGDVVRVAGSGFAPRSDLEVSLCSVDPVSCAYLTSGVVELAADGAVDLELEVDRFLPGPTPDTYVDCAVSTCSLRIFSSGSAVPAPIPLAFTFDDQVPVLPTLTVEPDTGVRAGDRLSVIGTGFDLDSEGMVGICAQAPDGDFEDVGYGYCTMWGGTLNDRPVPTNGSEQVDVDAAGSFRATIEVPAEEDCPVEGMGLCLGDCVVEQRCFVVAEIYSMSAGMGLAPRPVPITFADD